MAFDHSTGVVVGLAAEARIARRLSWRVAIGGGTAEGAQAAAEQLIGSGVRALVSFGLAGGLDPALRPGTIVVPSAVILEDESYQPPEFLTHSAQPSVMAALVAAIHVFRAAGKDVDGRDKPGHDEERSVRHPMCPLVSYATDPELTHRLGGATPHLSLATHRLVASIEAKRRLYMATGAAAVDLETGAVARTASARGLPFAVLRAICDPADRSLPPAAVVALDVHGVIAARRVLASLARRPNQLLALVDLGADAAAGRRALIRRTKVLASAHLSRGSGGEPAADLVRGRRA